MDLESFTKLVDEIMSLGFDEATATHYAELIGDLPTTDEKGRILVIEGDKVIDKLKLRFFQEQ